MFSQNGDESKSIDNIEKSIFIIALLKDMISFLKQQLIEKKNEIINCFKRNRGYRP